MLLLQKHQQQLLLQQQQQQQLEEPSSEQHQKSLHREEQWTQLEHIKHKRKDEESTCISLSWNWWWSVSRSKNIYKLWSIKNVCHFYFLNSSVKYWPIFFIIFGMQRQEETWCKWLQVWPPHLNTVATLPCEIQVIEPAVSEYCQRLSLAFVLEEDIWSTRCNKDDVIWHLWLFERIIMSWF